jgi:tetratricopeptide (TPR) repeat protein
MRNEFNGAINPARNVRESMSTKPPISIFIRLAVSILLVWGCYLMSVGTIHTGMSRLYSFLSIIGSDVAPADAAVRWAPDDPEAHYTRALALVNLNKLDEAIAELRRAIELRPHHYYQWLDLGVTLDRVGDPAGATAALEKAIGLAPSFAQPHWQLGNLRYREGRYPEAFGELRVAAQSNPNLYRGLLDLAWAASNGDRQKFEAFVQTATAKDRFTLAAFLAKQGRGTDAVKVIQQTAQPSDQVELGLIQETVSNLLVQRQFPEAYAAWKTSHPSAEDPGNGPLIDGGFTRPISQSDPGFGWQPAVLPAISVSIDPSGPREGQRSLQLTFTGEAPTSSPPIQQLVLVQPNTRYRLAFSAKTEGLVTGGPPVIFAISADADRPMILGQSGPIPVGTGQWRDYSFEFSTATGSAIVIGVQRAGCTQSPCPIFGKVWLSGFSLTKA